MFGPVHASEIPPEVCYSNCPRIYPRPVEEESIELLINSLPEEYRTDAGKKIYSERDKPCYLLFQFHRSQCRALRNYLISSSSRLEMMAGTYCGISTKVFNVGSNILEPNASIGILRFKNTSSAYRFVISENRFNRQEFLGGHFDIWNLTLIAEDQSVIPNPTNPDKMVNHMNVLHLIQVRNCVHLPEKMKEVTAAARAKAESDAAEAQKQMEEALSSVADFQGRWVVQTSAAARLRFMPVGGKNKEPGMLVYATQWKGVYHFWQWFESEQGRKFFSLIKNFTGSNYESLLLTLCLDFHDLM